MAKTRAAKDAFDLTGGANEFLEEQEKEVPKKETLPRRGRAKSEKSESSMLEQGLYTSMQVKIPKEIHKRLRYEQIIERSDEKLTMSQIIIEALQEHWGESPTDK